jgi:hypothetical protein
MGLTTIPVPAPPSPTKSFSLLNAGGTSIAGLSTLTISGISNMDDIYILVNSLQSTPTGNALGLRINADTTNKYGFAGMASYYQPAQNDNSGIPSLRNQAPNSISYIEVGGANYFTYTTWTSSIRISGGATSGVKMVQVIGGTNQYRGTAITGMGQYTGTSTISSITLFSLITDNYASGTVYVYGAN